MRHYRVAQLYNIIHGELQPMSMGEIALDALMDEFWELINATSGLETAQSNIYALRLSGREHDLRSAVDNEAPIPTPA